MMLLSYDSKYNPNLILQHGYAYDYDFLGQLISADYANAEISDESYTYDSNGNRVIANGSNYTTSTNNELTSDGAYTYTYDDEGNRISKQNSTNRELYTWDYRNRLTSVTQQTYNAETGAWTTTQTIEYTYNYNNVWIRKTLDSNGDGTADSKSIFIPENYQTVAQIDNGAVTHHYLWTPNQQDKLLADVTTEDILWALTDHLGTIRDIIGDTNATHLIYDAFGNLISGTNPILFAYTGKAFDTDTALQNNINRWYDATTGRWLSTDPIGFEGNDTNLYRYVGNMVHYTDSVGLKKCGPRVWLYTGSWCAEDNVWEVAIEAAGQSIRDGRTIFKPTASGLLNDTRKGRCGKDITDSLRQVKMSVENLLSDSPKRCKICSEIFNSLGKESLSNWDIDELARAGNAGSKEMGGTGSCAGTVTVGGRCYWAAEVNYFLYGLIAGICNSENVIPYVSYESQLLTMLYRGGVYGILDGRWFSEETTPSNRSWGSGIAGRLDWLHLGLTVNSGSPDYPSEYIQGCIPCNEKYPYPLTIRLPGEEIK